MDYIKIYTAVLKVYDLCDIKSFPIEPESVLESLGYKLMPYSALSARKRNACQNLSPDSCTIKNTIYYEDNQLYERIRFSIMHELGHIVLETDSESEANCFSNCFLAPRMAIHYTGCKNAADVAGMFKISLVAADIAFNNYRRWHRLAAYRLSPIDKEFYQHFAEDDTFVFKRSKCGFCFQKTAVNGNQFCKSCKEFLDQLDAERQEQEACLIPDSLIMEHLEASYHHRVTLTGITKKEYIEYRFSSNK